MSVFTFHGGVHPYDGKELSKDKPIQPITPVRDLVYPISQHIGAPAVPVVKKGDTVLVGQLIAEAGGFVSAPVYASVSGTVKAIEPHLIPSGSKCNSIVIENDGEYKEVEYETPRPLEEQSREEILEAVKKAGIVGMGGAGFPAHVKLSPKEPEKIDYIIANCAECEPYLTSDYRRMLEEPEKLIGGMRAVLKLFEHAKGILAVEDNKVDCALVLEKLLKGDKDIEVKVLKTKYPQGSERQLIYAATGRAINSSMLPADAGCVVHNVDTMCAIHQAVTEGKPLMSRIVTVTGRAIENPVNFLVRLGTSHMDLIEAAGGLKGEPEKIISGGPMMGIPLFDLEVPVVKTSSAILCMDRDEAAEFEPSACINCGRCVDVCPGRVIPSRLAKFASNGDKESFEKWNGMECCECGCCSYVCPAKRHLTQSIKTMRKQILADRKKPKPAPAPAEEKK